MQYNDNDQEYSVQLSLRQEWYDDRLAFNKISAYRSYNINSITLTEQERIWKPDLFFRNEKEGHFHKIILPNVLLRINGEGLVLFSIRISLVLACPMDLKYYPLDKQNCTIEMASYGYTDDDLKFVWKDKNPVQIPPTLSLPRFTLESSNTSSCTSRTSTGAYSCLRIDLIFKREFSYYLIQIYIPCCMLVIVSWVSFWLDPNAIPARVSLGVTTLLTMATQISGINASLPPVSYTKAIDVWTGVCLTFVFGALLEFALVNYASRSDAHHRMEQARQMDELRAREYEQRQLAALQFQQNQQQQQHLHQHHHQHQLHQQHNNQHYQQSNQHHQQQQIHQRAGQTFANGYGPANNNNGYSSQVSRS